MIYFIVFTELITARLLALQSTEFISKFTCNKIRKMIDLLVVTPLNASLYFHYYLVDKTVCASQAPIKLDSK